MSFGNPLTDSESAYDSYVTSPDPGGLDDSSSGSSPPPPGPYGHIRHTLDAAQEELRAMGLHVESSDAEVAHVLQTRFPNGIKPERVNPYTGLPFTRATESWAGQ